MIAPFFQIKNRKQFFQVFSVRFLIIKQHRKNDILLNGQFGNKIKRLKNKPDISTAKDCKPVVIHGKLKKQVKEYDVIKKNIDSILKVERQPEREKEAERG